MEEATKMIVDLNKMFMSKIDVVMIRKTINSNVSCMRLVFYVESHEEENCSSKYSYVVLNGRLESLFAKSPAIDNVTIKFIIPYTLKSKCSSLQETINMAKSVEVDMMMKINSIKRTKNKKFHKHVPKNDFNDKIEADKVNSECIHQSSPNINKVLKQYGGTLLEVNQKE